MLCQRHLKTGKKGENLQEDTDQRAKMKNQTYKKGISFFDYITEKKRS